MCNTRQSPGPRVGLETVLVHWSNGQLRKQGLGERACVSYGSIGSARPILVGHMTTLHITYLYPASGKPLSYFFVPFCPFLQKNEKSKKRNPLYLSNCLPGPSCK